jgi:hypothetical protein
MPLTSLHKLAKLKLLKNRASQLITVPARIILLFALSFTIPCFSQNSASNSKHLEEVNAVIQELFDGYRAGDSTRVRAVFTAQAQMQTIYTSTEGEQIISEPKSINGFVEYVGGGFEQVHDERLWDTQVHADHQFATVWTRYAFYLGEKFSHCGTETFLLRKVENDWKIFHLVDTRQKIGCKLPTEIKK